MRKPLRRIAGAALANVLILAALATPALAQVDETTTPDVSVTTTTTAPAETTSETSEPETTEPSTETSSSSETSSEEPTTTTTTTEPEPEPSDTEDPTTTTTEPSETTDSPEPTEPPYVDDTGYGLDLEDGLGLLLIACAAGEPKDLNSPDFEILEGPWQDETDGRYWLYLVDLRPGATFADGNVTADWVCGGEPGNGGGGSTPISPVPGSGDADDWQRENGGSPQVGFAPQGGVETGAGGAA
ncbi:hypothetical protein ABZ863_21940 [Saccharomonospora sp. NPDC046836]|uniref:hypothetical protein n=1 Tax=Saccharomonospora sp. NPDC046836 TaxID=3156921 RepID=UPI0033D65F4B